MSVCSENVVLALSENFNIIRFLTPRKIKKVKQKKFQYWIKLNVVPIQLYNTKPRCLTVHELKWGQLCSVHRTISLNKLIFNLLN